MVRNVTYDFQGSGFIRSSSASTERDSLVTVQQTENLTFFNPKAGVVYDLPNSQRLYASVGIGSKEPTRDEYVHSTPESQIGRASCRERLLGALVYRELS